MTEEADSVDWAQLVCTTDAETEPFLIGKDKFTIGRAKNSDISHENNKLVSGLHCYILRDETGKVWLYDSSTNGTLLNSKIKLSKGQRHEIEHGDEFFVVHKKGQEDVNIGYVFQDLARLREEEADDSGELDQTLEYNDGPPLPDATILDDSINQIDDDQEDLRSAVKRKLPRSPDSTEPGLSSKKPKEDKTAPPDLLPTSVPATSSDDKHTEKSGSDEREKGQGEKKESEAKTGEDAKEAKDEKKEKKEDQKETGKGGGGEEDAIAETLTCIICQEILHDCISLQPCMHSFCGGCYSGWMSHSSECPSCRGKVDRINKNHIVNNLVEAYLKEHPEKKRPDEDIKELDAKNKITRDMLYPERRRDSDSDFEDSDVEYDESDEAARLYPNYTPPPPAMGNIFGFGTPLFGAATNAYRAVCRQCPTAAPATGLIGSAINTVKGIFGKQTAATTATTTTTTGASAVPSTSGNNNNNNDNNNNNNAVDQADTPEAGPSGEQDHKERDKKVLPTPPDYTCAGNQNHVLCQCCLQIFPDRRTERLNNQDIPPQQCTICYKAFCHAYWGCRKADCNGCLAKFKDLNFGRKILTGLILDNQSESEIFTNYLDSKKIAVRDVLETCLTRLAEGTYSCPDQARYNITGETPLCYACGLRNFKALAYQYREDIPNDELPAEARNRPNCYWGKNCRTQRNKPAHAARFNHICEQTRT